MAVKIRLARFGKHKVPFYHIVATDSRNRRDSKFLEKLGTFNPLLDDDNKEKIVIKKDRAEYWLGVGAIPTDRAAILMIKVGVKGAEKYKPVFIPKKKAEKPIENESVDTAESTTESTSTEEVVNNVEPVSDNKVPATENTEA